MLLLQLLEPLPSLYSSVAASICQRTRDATGEERYLARLSSEQLIGLQASDMVAYSMLSYSGSRY